MMFAVIALLLVVTADSSVQGELPASQQRLAATGYRYSIEGLTGWQTKYWKELGQIILCNQVEPCTTNRGGYPLAGRGVIYIVPIEGLAVRQAPSSLDDWIRQSNEGGGRKMLAVSLPVNQRSKRRCVRTTGVDDLHHTVQIRRDVYYLQENRRFVKVILESNEGDLKYPQYVRAAMKVVASLDFEE